jgi:hydrogenase maturation factor
MQAGKLPTRLLQSILEKVPASDPRVVLGPGIGRDAAVIDAGGPNLLVAKTDPVTFAADRIGWYAVQVNANDIACLGARPCWFLATVLLPDGSRPALARSVIAQIVESCEALGIELVGGHTEVTLGLDRPIVLGAMLGQVARQRLVRPDGARPGDALVMTRGIAIEGTSVLAREASERLRSLGVRASTLAAARRYLTDPGISVVSDAQAACAAVPVHAMHDPTEGGLAAALYEMAAASHLGLTVDAESITVLPETEQLCRAAGLDPLGLLASGALLIALADADCGRLLDALSARDVPAKRIGTFNARRRVIMRASNQRGPVPRFARDELARFLSEKD